MKLNSGSLDSAIDDVLAFVSYLKKSGEAYLLEVASDLDLSFTHMRTMFVLAESPAELAVGEIAARLELSLVAAGRAVQALHRAGMVTRREDDRDRRVKRIGLSERGRTVVTGLAHARREGVRECVEPLSDNERRQLSKALAPILAWAAEQPAATTESDTTTEPNTTTASDTTTASNTTTESHTTDETEAKP